MSETMKALGDLYTLWQSDESCTPLDPECAPVVDRAMKLWAESRRDTWISVQGPTGSEISILASTITSVMRTTPAVRADAIMHDKAIDDERKANRLAAGVYRIRMMTRRLRDQ